MISKSVKITEISTPIEEEAESLHPPSPPGPRDESFSAGKTRRAYTYLGAHAEPDPKGKEQVVFRVWAPHAEAVSVVGSFADWEQGIPMERIPPAGLFTLSLPGSRVPDGSVYKYRITARDGSVLLRADPYGQAMECPPGTATRFLRKKPFRWHDCGWLRQRAKRTADGHKHPINIYELHPGSWKYGADGKPLSYHELADELAPYIKQMGYTHVELLPIMEHPAEDPWGYGTCGYYAPTARYGSPEDLRTFMDIMHNAGIGVILDWVPTRLSAHENGLCRFDGQPLYEYEDPAGIGRDTCCFDVGRGEVVSFLLSNAYYWVEEFHADGLRVDSVASLLYRGDPPRKRPPEKNSPRENRENRENRESRESRESRENRENREKRENSEAVAFLRLLNQSLREDHPDVITIAEGSTLRPHITDLSEDGLGFTHKWNMSWVSDTLRYAGEDPIFRRHHHAALTNVPSYAFAETHVLPISHNEVSRPERSLLDQMPGDYWQKFAGVRAFAAWMMTTPGAKLWFMGCEIGQFAAWNEKKQLDWHLLDYEYHVKLQHYFAALNNLYLTTPALWDERLDTPETSFEWLEARNADESIVAFRRLSREGKEVTVILNFTPVAHVDHNVNVPLPGRYREIFNSDDTQYGGSGILNTGIMEAFPVEDCPLRRIRINVPPMGVTVLERIEEKNEGLCPAESCSDTPVQTLF